MTILKQPPHSIELEQAVIGALLVDSAAIDKIADRLAVEDFYRQEHGDIYAACLALYEDSKTVDPVSVVERMKSKNVIDDSGVEYVADLVGDSRGSANVKDYARQMREKSVERQLLAASHKAGDIVYQDIPSAEKVHKAQQAFMEIGETQDKTALVGMDRLIKDCIGEIDYRASLGSGLIGKSTGFTKLDEMTGGLEKGAMVIVAGRPSMGKSTIAMNMVEKSIMRGENCVVFNLEMPRNSLMMRTFSSLSGIHHDKIRKGRLNAEDWPLFNEAVDKVRGKSLSIDDTPGLVTNQMRARLRRAARKAPIDMIVVDYLQIMGDQVKGNDTSRITHISRQLKSLAKEFNCPLVALSQLNRSVEDRPNKRPRMSDLRESGAIEQDADVIMFMYRDEYYDEQSPYKGMAEVIIAKQRNGPTGHIYLKSELDRMRFADYSGEIPTYQPKMKPFASMGAVA